MKKPLLDLRDPTLWGFIAAALATGLLVGTAWRLSEQQARANEAVAHTQEVLASIATARAELLEMQNAETAFIIDPTDDNAAALRRSVDRVKSESDELKALTFDEAAQQQELRTWEQALAPRIAAGQQAAELRRRAGLDAARAALRSAQGSAQTQQLRSVLQRLEAEENRMLTARIQQYRAQERLIWIATLGVLGALLLLLAALYWQIRHRQDVQRELLQYEQQFRLMAASILDYAIVMLDTSGRVVTWNTGAQRITGYREAEMLGRDFARLYRPEDTAADAPKKALVAARTHGRYEDEGWRVRADGTRLWAGVTITAVRDLPGALLGYCLVARDLTARKQAEDGLMHDMFELAQIVAKLRRLNETLHHDVQVRTDEIGSVNARLRETEAALQELSSRLTLAQEQERAHIARELHDETGQALTIIRMQLAHLQRRGVEDPQPIQDCITYVEKAATHIRGLSLNLRPPMLEDFGLVDALEWVLDQHAETSGWQVEFRPDGVEGLRFSMQVETACFRIAQEALTNAARYAQAHAVSVSLRLKDDELCLEVTDDGRGFDLARYRLPEERKRHFGLVSMHERAELAGGSLHIETAPGAGTRVLARFPASAAVVAA